MNSVGGAHAVPVQRQAVADTPSISYSPPSPSCPKPLPGGRRGPYLQSFD